MKIDKYKALTPEEEAIKIISKCFQEERNGDSKAREKARNQLKKFLVKTEDGSYTLNSNFINGKSETMHTNHGAFSESMEKFVKPSGLKGKGKVRVLDICSGLCYNAAACIEYLDSDDEIEIDMVEISKETIVASLLIENPVESYNIIKSFVEDELYNEGYLGFKLNEKRIYDKIDINIYIKDARNVVKELQGKKYDAIFLDPFSPAMCPELYTIEFFLLLKNMLKEDGIILTYTSAAPVRSAMIEARLYVGEGPKFGRKSGGTVASFHPENIEVSLSSNDERMIALSDAGIPYRDPDLNGTSDLIIKKRENERKSVRGVQKLASTVKTPIYLYKELEESRIKRRVLKNLNKIGIDNLMSEDAAFIVCPQFNECICDCNKNSPNNSNYRVNEMANRLSMIIEMRRSKK